METIHQRKKKKNRTRSYSSKIKQTNKEDINMLPSLVLDIIYKNTRCIIL